MPMSPDETLVLLRECHVANLPRMQSRCLGAVVIGYDNAEGADLVGIAVSTFRRHIASAEERVLDPLGLARLRATLVTWFWLHDECCTANIVSMIERNDLGRRRAK